PAHDPNDYECWRRNPQIAIINILNPDGTINAIGGRFAGFDRFVCRDEIVKAMDELGLFEGKEDREIPLKYSDRSKSPIEPYLSDQWFVRMGDLADGTPGLAQLAMDAVSSGQVKFTPDRYAKTYLEWLGEKRDWCISRQLWWGHRIPVWSKGNLTREETDDESAVPPGCVGEIHVDEGRVTRLVCVPPDHPEAEAQLAAAGYTQDSDVLDTWFSSALWPHSTLGWPDATAELDYYYPTSVLCTSRDIITLWVARMVLTSQFNRNGQIPFHHVYIHPKLLDGFGETMSKSKGNGIDPLDIIDLYGTDALRFGMVSLATETQDSRMPVVNVCPHCGTQVPVKQEHMYMRTKKLNCPGCQKAFRPGGPWQEPDPSLPTAKQASDRFELGRNFANKLWNATRFILMNIESFPPQALEVKSLPLEDRWILSRLATTQKAVTNALEQFRFFEVSKLIYDFAWNEFCDWYIELSKTRRADPVCQNVLVGVLDGIIRLIQPVMPFIAESLWEALAEAAPTRGIPTPTASGESACIAPWPSYPAELIDAATETSFARMQELVRGIREIRNQYQVDEKTAVPVSVRCEPGIAAEFNQLGPFIAPLAGVSLFTCGPSIEKPKQAGTIIRPEFECYVALAGLIDVETEKKRLTKQIAEKQKLLEVTQGKLANANFTSRAPAEVVQQQQELVKELETQLQLMAESLAELSA
ncbi:MAG: class I tRNA ligase family protein, partial [Gemmataceae bacterium]